METTGKQEMRIAVKCKQCNMTIFYENAAKGAFSVR